MNTGSFYKDGQHKHGNISGFAAGCTCFSRIKQKAPTFQSRLLCFFPLFIKRWFQSFDLHTLCLTNRFVCNFLSSSAGFNLCSCFFPAHPCLPLSLPTFSGPDLHTACRRYPVSFLTPAVFAFFRPLQFWVLTTQPLFLLFPLLPASASQWLPQCSALAFAPSVFPVLSCLVSRAFFPGSGTQLRCMFPFALP